MKKTRVVALFGALSALALVAPVTPVWATGESGEDCCSTTIQQVSIAKVRAIAAGKQKGVIIDSRSAEQYKAGHIPRAISVPAASMTASRLPKDKATPVVFYCGAEQCPLSSTAAEKAVKWGYKNVAVYKGGWSGWTQTASR
jgi:rhodanese-related sulfurtransferase